MTAIKDYREAQLRIENVSKVFTPEPSLLRSMSGRRSTAGYIALEDVNLRIEDNTFVSIIGPSGCSKSTLLNLMA